MKKMMLAAIVLCFGLCDLQAQSKDATAIVFEKKEITFAEHPGLVFRVSKPYLSVPWTGATPSFALALEFTNGSDKDISAMGFFVTLFDKAGKKAVQMTAGAGPMTFEPKDGNVLKKGYKGVSRVFITRDKSFMDQYGKIEIQLTEVTTPSMAGPREPVWGDNWLMFKDFPGLSCRLSQPYGMVDALSGEERFAIAIEFKNESKKNVGLVYYSVVIYDDQGPLYENEIQEFGDKYDPRPRGMDALFPDGYIGINRTFYTQDMSLFKSFKKIDVNLIKVE